jgi:hypothetical protein
MPEGVRWGVALLFVQDDSSVCGGEGGGYGGACLISGNISGTT